jgi:hypothetical protein
VLELLNVFRWVIVDLFRSRKSLEAEVITLRQQLNVLRRSAAKRPALSRFDRLLFVFLYRLVPSVLDAVTIVRPETVIRWHRAGFRAFWRWKSRARRAGRPQVPIELRQLIRQVSIATLSGALLAFMESS